jgi:hypothetical protein
MEDENGTKNEGMSEPEMLKIDQASRAVLEEIGTLADNEAALDLFNQAGAHVDPKKKLVKIPDHIINDTVAKCSSCVNLYDRAGDTPLIIGGDRIYFGTVGIATNVLDFETNQYRQVICDDFVDIVRLSDVPDPPDFILVPATPTDVSTKIVDTTKGALIGGRRTLVEAVDVYTVGSGDSHVDFNRDHNLTIGPKRVVPLSLLGVDHPEILKTLRRQRAADIWENGMSQFLVSGRSLNNRIGNEELAILEAIKAAPVSLQAKVNDRDGFFRRTAIYSVWKAGD